MTTPGNSENCYWWLATRCILVASPGIFFGPEAAWQVDRQVNRPDHFFGAVWPSSRRSCNANALFVPNTGSWYSWQENIYPMWYQWRHYLWSHLSHACPNRMMDRVCARSWLQISFLNEIGVCFCWTGAQGRKEALLKVGRYCSSSPPPLSAGSVGSGACSANTPSDNKHYYYIPKG